MNAGADGGAAPQCRTCGHTDTRFALEATSVVPGLDGLRRFFSCTRCGTLLDVDVAGPAYDADGEGVGLTDESPHVKFYVEYGGGLETFAACVSLLRAILGDTGRAPRLLEVGAGFGLMLSVARAAGFDPLGVEPSGIGRVGSAVLDVPILRSLEETTASTTFDAVVSTEVIEHIAEPGPFLAALCARLADDGVLLLTTPNAEVLTGDRTTELEWTDALSPGAHLTLLAPRGLERLCRDHGLQEVRTLLSGGSSGRKQIVMVARRRGALPGDLDWQEALRAADALVLTYLRQIVGSREEDGVADAFYRGALFRLERRLVDLGAYAQALPIIWRIDGLLRTMGHDEPGLAAFTPNDFGDYVSRVPAFLGLHYYYRGIVETNHLAQYERAAGTFALAGRLCRIQNDLGFYPTASWSEWARYHEALALSLGGRVPEAVAALDELRAQAARLPRDLTAGVARLHARLTGNPGRQGMAARATALLDRMRGGPARD